MFTRYCTRCRAEIDPKRASRGSCFCSTECRRLDKIGRLNLRAVKKCRLCGRAFGKKKTPRSATCTLLAAPDGPVTVTQP